MQPEDVDLPYYVPEKLWDTGAFGSVRWVQDITYCLKLLRIQTAVRFILSVFSGIKMTRVSKMSLLVFVTSAQFQALTATFWQVCAQPCHMKTHRILNTTSRCGCYVTGACVIRNVRNRTGTRDVIDHLGTHKGSFEHEY